MGSAAKLTQLDRTCGCLVAVLPLRTVMNLSTTTQLRRAASVFVGAFPND